MKKINNHVLSYFSQLTKLSNSINKRDIDRLATTLAAIRKKEGRVFFLGVGGSAGNCSHAVNDFRKICEIECYTPTDNVSELTARINDDGWESAFANWLQVSKLNSKDILDLMTKSINKKFKENLKSITNENILETDRNILVSKAS